MKYSINSTEVFDKWFTRLKDSSTKRKILARLARVENNNFGDCKQIADELFELRFFFASGIRIYYTIRNNEIVLLLVGGNKASQSNDIEEAKKLVCMLNKQPKPE
jgi:putative addiction module killer protein